MSGRYFLMVWGVALTATALVVGWAFAAVSFGLPAPAAFVVGFVPPIACAMAVMWAVVRS